MLKMRLQRRGKKNYATYRVVVAEVNAPVKGRFVADIGSYNPHTDAFNVNKDEVDKWLSKGVKPSSTVHNLLVTHELLKAEKVKSWRPKKREGEEKGEKKEEVKEEAGEETKKEVKEETKEEKEEKKPKEPEAKTGA